MSTDYSRCWNTLNASHVKIVYITSHFNLCHSLQDNYLPKQILRTVVTYVSSDCWYHANVIWLKYSIKNLYQTIFKTKKLTVCLSACQASPPLQPITSRSFFFFWFLRNEWSSAWSLEVFEFKIEHYRTKIRWTKFSSDKIFVV